MFKLEAPIRLSKQHHSVAPPTLWLFRVLSSTQPYFFKALLPSSKLPLARTNPWLPLPLLPLVVLLSVLVSALARVAEHTSHYIASYDSLRRHSMASACSVRYMVSGLLGSGSLGSTSRSDNLLRCPPARPDLTLQHLQAVKALCTHATTWKLAFEWRSSARFNPHCLLVRRSWPKRNSSVRCTNAVPRPACWSANRRTV